MIMKYQKIINLLDNTPNQPSKFRTKNRVERNDDLLETYSTNSQIKFMNIRLKLSLCDYSDAYIIVKGTIKITGDGEPPAGRTAAQIQTAREKDERNKGVIFKKCATFTDWISEIKDT